MLSPRAKNTMVQLYREIMVATHFSHFSTGNHTCELWLRGGNTAPLFCNLIDAVHGSCCLPCFYLPCFDDHCVYFQTVRHCYTFTWQTVLSFLPQRLTLLDDGPSRGSIPRTGISVLIPGVEVNTAPGIRSDTRGGAVYARRG